MSTTRPRLGEVLVKNGVITGDQLDEALAIQAERGGKIGPILEDLFGVRAEDIADARVDQAWPELTETDNGSGSA
ncbi:MAG TPA: hypothetical protein PLD23_07665 [Armatimonadota bacterium]|nr:hypothetical protein [Armatimonadota bacterium]HQK93367.1 hypothetical protein [Armatimonadota bacterium]